MYRNVCWDVYRHAQDERPVLISSWRDIFADLVQGQAQARERAHFLPRERAHPHTASTRTPHSIPCACCLLSTTIRALNLNLNLVFEHLTLTLT